MSIFDRPLKVRIVVLTGLEDMMWVLDIFQIVIDLILDGCGALAPRASVWYWISVTLIVCVLIGLGIYFWN